MSDETLLYIAYGVVFVILITIGIAMWRAGKEGGE
jgi:hypothetical protein